MECTMCNEEHGEKTKTVFNIKLNNHRADVNDSNAMLACKHFEAVRQQARKIYNY